MSPNSSHTIPSPKGPHNAALNDPPKNGISEVTDEEVAQRLQQFIHESENATAPAEAHRTFFGASEWWPLENSQHTSGHSRTDEADGANTVRPSTPSAARRENKDHSAYNPQRWLRQNEPGFASGGARDDPFDLTRCLPPSPFPSDNQVPQQNILQSEYKSKKEKKRAKLEASGTEYGADLKVKGNVTEVDGSLYVRYRGEVQPAVYHADLRAEMIAQNPPERYLHPPARGVDDLDLTSFWPSHATWGFQTRDDRPDILFEFLPTERRTIQNPGVMKHNRRIVIDQDGHPVRDWSIPACLSSEVEPGRLEAMYRESGNKISKQDFRARMPPLVPNGNGGHKEVVTLTAIGMRDLTMAEIAHIDTTNRGANPEKAGGKALSEDQRKIQRARKNNILENFKPPNPTAWPYDGDLEDKKAIAVAREFLGFPPLNAVSSGEAGLQRSDNPAPKAGNSDAKAKRGRSAKHSRDDEDDCDSGISWTRFNSSHGKHPKRQRYGNLPQSESLDNVAEFGDWHNLADSPVDGFHDPLSGFNLEPTECSHVHDVAAISELTPNHNTDSKGHRTLPGEVGFRETNVRKRKTARSDGKGPKCSWNDESDCNGGMSEIPSDTSSQKARRRQRCQDSFQEHQENLGDFGEWSNLADLPKDVALILVPGSKHQSSRWNPLSLAAGGVFGQPLRPENNVQTQPDYGTSSRCSAFTDRQHLDDGAMWQAAEAREGSHPHGTMGQIPDFLGSMPPLDGFSTAHFHSAPADAQSQSVVNNEMTAYPSDSRVRGSSEALDVSAGVDHRFTIPTNDAEDTAQYARDAPTSGIRSSKVPMSKHDIKSPPSSVPFSLSSLILPAASQSLSHTLSSLKRSTLSITNRLSSIHQDSLFVQRVANHYNLPLIANERCGSWYIPPELKMGSAYFKSTDGHQGQWTFSTRRLNLQVLDIVGKHGGYGLQQQIWKAIERLG
ncbi:MAG: hypothetical protein Q9201_003166 [Fulgogasparrea decipioides]